MKNQIMQFRQGDVFIERIEEFTKTRPRNERHRGVLAYGEVTGHSHSLTDPDSVTIEEMEEAVAALGDLDLIQGMSDLALTVHKETTLVHQEHAPITLPPGKYIVRIQREYSPQAIHRVAD